MIDCTLNISLKIEDISKEYKPDHHIYHLILPSNDEHQLHDKIYKISMLIDNYDNNYKCFPSAIAGEFYNVDFSVISNFTSSLSNFFL